MLCTINKCFLYLNNVYSLNLCILDKKKYCISIKDLFKFHIYCAVISLFFTFKFNYLENTNISVYLYMHRKLIQKLAKKFVVCIVKL